MEPSTILAARQFNDWVKLGIALSLSVSLQAISCARNPGGIVTHAVKNSNIESFASAIDNTKNISLRDKERDWLLAAVHENDQAKVEVILNRVIEDKKEGLDAKYQNNFPNSVDENGKTALCIAIEKGNQKIVECLLGSQAIDINKVDNKEKPLTSLLVALQHKQEKIATYLFHQNDIDLTTKDPVSGCTPLHLSIKNELHKITTLLIKQLDSSNLLVADGRGRTAFHMLARNNNKTVFTQLFNQVADKEEQSDAILKVLFQKDPEGRSVFANAYLSKHNVAICFVGFNSESKDLKMFTCLLDLVKHLFAVSDETAILSEIETLTNNRTITSEYATQLKDALKEIK